jgi:hypothetical protein
MKDCPDCWHEVLDTTATECECCGCKFIMPEHTEANWEEYERTN